MITRCCIRLVPSTSSRPSTWFHRQPPYFQWSTADPDHHRPQVLHPCLFHPPSTPIAGESILKQNTDAEHHETSGLSSIEGAKSHVEDADDLFLGCEHGAWARRPVSNLRSNHASWYGNCQAINEEMGRNF